MSHYFINDDSLKSEKRIIKYTINSHYFELTSDIGVFSKNELDPGSELLIKTAIKELYESKDRYDVFEAMEKEDAEPKDNTATIIAWNLVFTAIATSIILYVNDRHVKVLNARIDTLENSLHKKK